MGSEKCLCSRSLEEGPWLRIKGSPHEVVRRSVANHLNDISKDNPDILLDICEGWYGESPEVDWVVRHACRGLLKKGNPRALALFGFGDPVLLQISNLTLKDPVVVIEGELGFNFDLCVEGDDDILVRVEYVIDFVKAKGKQRKTVGCGKASDVPIERWT